MKICYCLLIAAITVACSSHGAAPASDIAAVPFGRLDATVALGANANTLSQDYDSGSIAMYKAFVSETPAPTNMVFSAYAVQTAMGMMYAGAGGNTATNMAQAMRWRLSPADLPAAHAQLTTVIATDANSGAIELATGTRIWVDQTLGLKDAYAAVLSQNYQASPVVQPLLPDPEASRQIINGWVSQQTNTLIPELLPAHALDGDTLVVQTAAIYFKAAWTTTFERDAAASTPFTHLDSSQTPVTMIRATGGFQYADANNYQAIDIPYGRGSMAWLVVMPKGSLTDFEQSLDGAFVHQVLAGLTSTEVRVALPVLNLQQTPDMTGALHSMGLVDAFSDSADFSAIGTRAIEISQAFEQAVLKLDENGTEAAAAAAVIGQVPASGTAEPPLTFTVDHPFFFAIHDMRSNTPLFTGRVVAP